MTRPNILYIHSHDTGRSISPYGCAVHTPRFERLAAEGTIFRKAFCASPSCSPSRAALLTGQAPHCSGMLGLAHRGWSLNDYGQHLIHTLRPAGYRSALCGIQHIAHGQDAAQIIGYDEHIASKDGRAVNVAPAAAAWLESSPEEPFFLDVGFFETHTHPGESLFDCGIGDPRYVKPPAPLPDTAETRQDWADYHESVKVLDSALGTVLDALEEAGLAENTLVICTTDHGNPLPSMKCNLTDTGTGVLLMMRGPAIEAGGVVDELISHIDVFPTVCDYLDIAKPLWLQGHSFWPVLQGKQGPINEAVFMEVTYHAAYEPMRAVRTDRWKYIRKFDGRMRPVMPNCDDSRSKTYWVEKGWPERRVEQEQLFDLVFDPYELNNLAAGAEYHERLGFMRAMLDEWMERTADPILRGPVPLAPGGITTDPDNFSP